MGEYLVTTTSAATLSQLPVPTLMDLLRPVLAMAGWSTLIVAMGLFLFFSVRLVVRPSQAPSRRSQVLGVALLAISAVLLLASSVSIAVSDVLPKEGTTRPWLLGGALIAVLLWLHHRQWGRGEKALFRLGFLGSAWVLVIAMAYFLVDSLVAEPEPEDLVDPAAFEPEGSSRPVHGDELTFDDE
ncbi:MAG: hypothetical protein KC731_32930 [Myxococcales bacterium]|nr:hypothetical protein [Myxococcales bacterium]